MAVETYNEKINRSTDWGGDASTGHLPVSGKRVQEFIKEELSSKVGEIYLDRTQGMYLCFANVEDREQYILNRDESLVIGKFTAVSYYTVFIENTTVNNAVLASSTGNQLSYRFKVIDTRNEQNTGEDVKCTYIFSNPTAGSVKTFSEDLKSAPDSEGWTNRVINIDDYITTGTNSITIRITGQQSYALSQIGVGFEMVDLNYTPSFDYSKAWKDNSQITMQYSISCAKPKVIETYIDGVHMEDFDRTVQTITGGDYIYIPIDTLESGVHTLQTRAYIRTDSGAVFYSENFYYEFVVDRGDLSTPTVVLHKEIEDGSLIDKLTFSPKQFEVIEFEWGFYDPQNRNLPVTFSYNNTQITSIQKNNSDEPDTFVYRPTEIGKGHSIKIEIGDEYESSIDVDVNRSEVSLAETTDGLVLKLSAMGRSNDEPTDVRNSWTYFSKNDNKTYSTEFTGFEWNNLQGWSDNSLVISDGAQISIDITPMFKDWTVYGGSVEVDIETFDVEDEDAVILNCEGAGGNNYFRINATSAKMKTSGSDPIENRFRDGERQKIVFIGNSAAKGDDDTREDANLIYIVSNGVLERAVNYGSSDSMTSNAKLVIGNPDGKVKCRLHSIRVYNRAITVDEAFNNFVVDSDEIQTLYDRNDILDDAGENVLYDKVVNKIPVLIFTGDVPELMKYADKKIKRYFDIQYTNNFEPERNFTSFHVETKLQGTSSLGYPRKNFKIKTKNKEMDKKVFATTEYYFDNDTDSPYYRRLCYKETNLPLTWEETKEKLSGCITFTYEGEIAKKGKLQVKSSDCMPVDVWTLKADYMESSSSHNTGVARVWNDIMKNTKMGDTRTYVSSAKVVEDPSEIASQDSYVCRTEAQKVAEAYKTGEVRTTVDGFPIVVFYRLDYNSPLVFMGQYNFNNDKSSEDMFGFKDIEIKDAEGNKVLAFDGSPVECWENLQNTNDISLFINQDKFSTNWSDAFESRYPEDPQEKDPVTGEITAEGYVLENLKELLDWVTSTRHDSKDTVIDSNNTIHISSDFAKRINNYQYEYTQESVDGTTVVPAVYHYPETGDYPDTPENRQLKFMAEKWEHFDMWKLAGYYIYLIRFGAVDQFVKNSMMTTEGVGKFGGDYKKWYFINYDNDCVFGLRNNGGLAFGYDMDRNTMDPAYAGLSAEDLAKQDIDGRAMMGYRSTLWNNLEADPEFMRMVRALDNAMAQAGLNYGNLNKIFDEGQVDRWCERIYNANERYKYIMPFRNENKNNLFMLQGTRKSHRHWWLSNRMEYYDAKWISGDYRSKILEMKADSEAGKKIKIVPGADFYYAWGTNSALVESNVELNPKSDDPSKHYYEFVSPMRTVQGDPIRVYAINKIASIDVSDYGSGIFNMNFAKIDGDTTHELKKIIIGNADTWVENNIVNNSLNSISTIANCPNLEYLDITNCSKISTVSLSKNPRLNTLRAKGSVLNSFIPCEGSKLTLVELPNTINVLELNNVQFTNSMNDFVYTPNKNLRSLKLKNSSNAGVTMAYYRKFVKPWLDILKASYAEGVDLYSSAEMVLTNVKWNFGDIEDAYYFGEFIKNAKLFDISGVIDLKGYGSLTSDDLRKCRDLFGEGCFNETNKIYIIAPTSNFIKTRDERNFMVAGETTEFYCEIYPTTPASYKIEYTFVRQNERGEYVDIENVSSVRQKVSLVNRRNSDSEFIATLTCPEEVLNTDSKCTVRAKMTVVGGNELNSYMEFTIKDPTYPSSKSVVEGDTSIYTNPIKRISMGDEENLVYELKPLTNNGSVPIGTYEVEWSLEGEGIEYVDLEKSGVDPNNQLHYNLVTLEDKQPEISSRLHVKAKITPTNGDIVNVELVGLILNNNVILTRESNPVVMSVCYENGWAANEDALTLSEAEAIYDFGTAFSGVTDTFDFMELPYFKNVTTLGEYAFAGSGLRNILIPNTIVAIEPHAFEKCTKLVNVTLPNTINEIANSTFNGCTSLSDIEIPSSVTFIDSFAFGNTNIECVCVAESTEDEYTNDAEMYNEMPHPYYGEKRGMIIHEGLREINDSAFESTTLSDPLTWNNNSTNKLKMIEFPISFLRYGEDVVRGKNLEAIYVRPANLEYASVDCVLYNKKLETLFRYPAMKADILDYTPMNVYLFSNFAFYNTKLDSVKLLNNLNSNGLGTYCFCYSTIKKIDMALAANLETLPLRVFYGCSNLVDVIFPEDSRIKYVREQAFYNCSSLVELIFPDGVEEFGQENSTITDMAQRYSHIFDNCHNLKTLHIPDSVVGDKLGWWFLYNCNGIEAFRFPKYVSCRTVAAIENCPNIKEITFPVFSYTSKGEYKVVDKENVYDSYEEALLAANNIESDVEVLKEPQDTIVNDNNIPNLFLNGYADGRFTKLETVKINEEDNGEHAFVDHNCLYWKNGDSLEVFFTPHKMENFFIRKDTTSIKDNMFSNIVDSFAEVVIDAPKLTYVGNASFERTDIKRIYLLTNELPTVLETSFSIAHPKGTMYLNYGQAKAINDFKGFIYNTDELPLENNNVGDKYIIEDPESHNKLYYEWDGIEWSEIPSDDKMWRWFRVLDRFDVTDYIVTNTISITLDSAEPTSEVYLKGELGDSIAGLYDSSKNLWDFALSTPNNYKMGIFIDDKNIGYIIIDKDILEYTPTLVSSRSRVMRAMAITTASASETETVTISKYQYDILNSKINQINAKLNILNK